MSTTPQSARQEISQNWLLVIAAMVGLSLGSMHVSALGLFMEPMGAELGWSRTEITLGLLIFTFLAVPAAPFVGILVDRLGSRRLALPGTLAVGVTFAAFGLTGSSILQWVLLWVVYTLACLLIKVVVWTAEVSRAFDKARGMALAAALSGTALASVIAPGLARWLIDDFGWRYAFHAMGLGWALVAFVTTLLFFRVRPAFDAAKQEKLHTAKHVGAAVPTGLTAGQARRDPTVIRLGLSALFSTVALTALVVHLVPILTETGITRATAAQLAGLSGLAAFFSKFVNGWLLDTIDGRWLGWTSAGLTGVACLLLLWTDGSPTVAIAFAIIIGYAMGAYLQVLIYYTTRYAGMRAYGVIFGVISSALAFGAGVGPMIGSLIYDHLGSYDTLLMGSVATAAVSTLLLYGLAPYPNWELRDQTKADTEADAGVGAMT